MNIPILALIASFTVQIVNESGSILEPSIVNEVEHALERAATNAPPCQSAGDVFGTNNLSAAQAAIAIVSKQDANGCWFVNGTNVTSEAVGILSSLLKPYVAERPPVVHNPEDVDILRERRAHFTDKRPALPGAKDEKRSGKPVGEHR